MFRAVGIVSALIAVCAPHEAKAAAVPQSPTPEPIKPQAQIYETERTVPCLDHRDPHVTNEYYLE